MVIQGYQFSVNSILEKLLVRIRSQEKQLNALSISPELFQKMFKRNYLRQAYSSTKIEYSLIGFNAAQKVLNLKKAQNEEGREILNVANTHLAMARHLNDRISDDLIISIHRQISEGLKGSLTEPNYRPGSYRTIQNYLGDPFSDRISYTFPDPKKVPKLMQRLSHFTNEKRPIEKLLIPGISHFIFIAIHPFVNGNGRTARVLEDLLLKKAGYNSRNFYNLSEYYYTHLKQYHFFLNRGREQMDLTEFVEFYLRGILESQNNVFHEKIVLERLARLHELSKKESLDVLDKKILNYLIEKEELTMKKALKLTSKKITSEALRLRFQKYMQWGIMAKTGDYKNAKYIFKIPPAT
ncbi:MAG: Fic family protein [Candidatus Gracilibacteria bacterium]